MWVEYLTLPTGEIHGATLELLKEMAKGKKKVPDPKKSTGMLTRLTSNLRSPVEKSPRGSPLMSSRDELTRLSSSRDSGRASSFSIEKRKGSMSSSAGAASPLPRASGAAAVAAALMASTGGASVSEPVFGQPLDEVMARERERDSNAVVPRCVRDGISYIFRRGLAVEGIFRLSGAKGEVDGLKQAYDDGEEVDLNTLRDPNVVASMLKAYLRELPEPLLPVRDYDAYLGAVQLESDSATVARLSSLLKTVSPNSRALLSEFVRVLSCVARNSRVNKMIVANCSIVLGPNILRKAQGDMQDVRHTASLAMDSGDVNKVSEFLLKHPHLVSDVTMPFAVGTASHAEFETKLVGPHNKSVVVVMLLNGLICAVDTAGCGSLWNPERFDLTTGFDIGWRPIGAVSTGTQCWIFGQKGVDVRDATGAQLFARASNPFFCGAVVGQNVWLGTDKAVSVFESASFSEVGRATVDCELLFAMCYVEGTNEVWGGGLDNSLNVYDASAPFALKHSIKAAQKKRVNQMCVRGAILFAASEDGTVTVWSTETRESLQLIRAHDSRCNAVISVNNWLWTCGWDTTIRIFDEHFNLVQTLTGFHDDGLFSLVRSGDYVWSASGDKGLVAWRIK